MMKSVLPLEKKLMIGSLPFFNVPTLFNVYSVMMDSDR